MSKTWHDLRLPVSAIHSQTVAILIITLAENEFGWLIMVVCKSSQLTTRQPYSLRTRNYVKNTDIYTSLAILEMETII